MTDQIDGTVRELSDLSTRPSLHALSYALRHPETWPEDFVWDYGEWDQCAVALAQHLWGRGIVLEGQAEYQTWIARTMAMPYADAMEIFFALGPIVKRGFFRRRACKDYSAVMPDTVANAIDRYLARQKADRTVLALYHIAGAS